MACNKKDAATHSFYSRIVLVGAIILFGSCTAAAFYGPNPIFIKNQTVTDVIREALYSTDTNPDIKTPEDLLRVIFQENERQSAEKLRAIFQVDNSNVLGVNSFESKGSLMSMIELLKEAKEEALAWSAIESETHEHIRGVIYSADIEDHHKESALRSFNKSVNDSKRSELLKEKFSALVLFYSDIISVYDFLLVNYDDYTIEYLEGGEGYVDFASEAQLENYNKLFDQVLISGQVVDEANTELQNYIGNTLQTNGVDIPVNEFYDAVTPESNSEISGQLQSLTNDVKALDLYLQALAKEEVGDNTKAAALYYEAAKYYPKNSANYYDALIEAEWTLNNTEKTLALLQEAYVKYPKEDIILADYGHFLLGLNKISKDSQNITLALKVNTELVANLEDDMNLLNLALTYILLGDEESLNTTIKRFTDFDSGDNYSWFARAYHRVGNQEKASYYRRLAEKEGSFVKADVEFFSFKF